MGNRDTVNRTFKLLWQSVEGGIKRNNPIKVREREKRNKKFCFKLHMIWKEKSQVYIITTNETPSIGYWQEAFLKNDKDWK